MLAQHGAAQAEVLVEILFGDEDVVRNGDVGHPSHEAPRRFDGLDDGVFDIVRLEHALRCFLRIIGAFKERLQFSNMIALSF